MKKLLLILSTFISLTLPAQRLDSTYSYYFDNQWVNSGQTIEIYNQAEHTQTIYKQLNTQLQMFENSSRYTYSYTQGNTSLIITEYWDTQSNSWNYSQKREISYTAQNKVLNQIVYFYDMDSLDWAPSLFYHNQYDNTGFLEQQKLDVFDSQQGTWVNSNKIEYIKNPGTGLLQASIYYHWDLTLQDWLSDNKTQNNYNADNLPDTIITGTFDGIVYTPNTQYVYTYQNGTDSTSTIIIQQIDTLGAITNIEKDLFVRNTDLTVDTLYTAEWDSDALNWTFTGFNKYFYSQPVGINTPANSLVKLYPNPTANSFKIATQDILTETIQYQIVDAMGHLVKSGIYNAIAGVDIATLAQGRYYVHIIMRNGATVVPFIKS